MKELNINQLFKLALKNVDYDEKQIAQDNFCFALLKICNDCHSGQNSYLYSLSRALSIEWQFSPGPTWTGEISSTSLEQWDFFLFLVKHLELKEYYPEYFPETIFNNLDNNKKID